MPEEFVEYFAYEKVGFVPAHIAPHNVYYIPADQPEEAQRFIAAWNKAYPERFLVYVPGSSLQITVPSLGDPFADLPKGGVENG